MSLGLPEMCDVKLGWQAKNLGNNMEFDGLFINI